MKIAIRLGVWLGLANDLNYHVPTQGAGATKMLNTVSKLLLLLLLIGSTGCVIEEGVGPEGPPGNANVFSLNFDFLLADAVINNTVASVQYDVPDITPLVVDEGAVLMFFRDQGTWTAMPYTFGVESADLPAVDYTVSLGFGFEDGFLEVFYESSTAAIDFGLLPDREMKAVVIDGFFFGKKAIDYTDWNVVKGLYNLED
ncbi:MAG: hypothetical protein HOC28_02685 [Bacteroidetes Order II. Incertae sedis bacterium]|jgi:hypothetical protein|nr:hypothetical protein [Bacteroidetes Order II. bacterium]MBT4052273.1 hypothetical protein [Bacteroidetes Order II. bacterium]MBT4602020.1 hypothetical protein [Bacteroidetes Order II. bacterium]MBT5250320.1 hypothetical protein [Bacteroidetes Order II. bacterium]MBT6201919.1 hypothetical protein [Bacteroidetes Order II. bacterium]